MLLALPGIVPALPADATTITFDFNALSDGASNATVQSYMQLVVTAALPGQTVTITGSRAEQNYTGDNHVVGTRVNGGGTLISETLGTSDGARWVSGQLVDAAGNPASTHGTNGDTWIQNYGSTTVTITFSFLVHSVSFDYEIFPDATCPTPTNCGTGGSNWPDFTFKAGGVTRLHTIAVTPGLSGTPSHSPLSGPISDELAPQFLGISGTFFFPDGVTQLQFIDWPVMVGIDNLVIGVPEPSSLSFAAVAALALLVGVATGALRARS